MEAPAKRRPRRPRRPTPYVGPPCLACGHDTLVVPCVRRECGRWFVLCGGCADELDRYVETDGRCPYCRVQ